jgi:hypothetical protein
MAQTAASAAAQSNLLCCPPRSLPELVRTKRTGVEFESPGTAPAEILEESGVWHGYPPQDRS